MNDQPNTLTADVVNAIVRDMDDPRYPSQITVFCDHCGVENTGDYMVSEDMTRDERLAVARKHLVANEGWEHTADGDDFCPEHAAPKPTAPDRPYTDEDLRAEAARQHVALTEDPDFMGIGEQMQDTEIESLIPPEEADGAEGTHWDELLDEDQFNEAQRQIHDLINGAADVSEWAINLGADGLEPSGEHLITVSADNGVERPIARIHFAFEPGMPEEMRTAFVQGIGQSIDAHLS